MGDECVSVLIFYKEESVLVNLFPYFLSSQNKLKSSYINVCSVCVCVVCVCAWLQ